MTTLDAEARENRPKNGSCSEAGCFPSPTCFCSAVTSMVKVNFASYCCRQPIKRCFVRVRDGHFKVGILAARQPYANRALAINQASDVPTICRRKPNGRNFPFPISGSNGGAHPANIVQAVSLSHVFTERDARQCFTATIAGLFCSIPNGYLSAPPRIIAILLVLSVAVAAPSLAGPCFVKAASRAFPHTDNPIVSQQDCQPPALSYGLARGWRGVVPGV